MPINTSTRRMSLVAIKIVMVMLHGLSLSVFATPLVWEPEWSAIVIPITQSPATSKQNRLTAQSKDSRWCNHLVTLTDSESAGTVTEAPHLYRTCSGSSCRDLNRSYTNRNVDDRHDNKNRHSQNRQETKRRGNNHRSEKKRCACGGKNHRNCGKNQHQKHCDKNRCELKSGGKNQGKKHCGEKRNGQCRHDATHCNRQNNPPNNMKNGKKRRQFVVDNKVIINVNDGQTPGPTVINVNDDRKPGPTVIDVKDGRTPGPTLIPWIDSTVATVQVSMLQSVRRSCCSSCSVHEIVWWLSLLAIICIAMTFCIYRVYLISDRSCSRGSSIMY